MRYDPVEVINRIKNIYNASSNIEQQVLRQILEELSLYGESKTYEDVWLADYTEIPVDINTFLCSDEYLGLTNNHGESVYPFWKNTLSDIFNAGNMYNEVVLTGATRIGKTSTVISAVAYMTYKLMCLRDPQAFFNKKDISKFSILFFNVTKDLAKSVAFREFNDTLRESPWFLQHGKFSKSERDFYYIPDGGKITIDYGSMGVHALGLQCYCGILDEANFARAGIKDVQKAKANMMDTYNTISARIKGTFRKGGEVYGKLFAISSKKSDNDFLESHIQTQLSSGAGDHMYIVDKPQWEVLPSSMFSERKFYIAVGDRYNKGFVVPDNQTDEQSLEDIRSQGYTILTPPEDMKPEFVADFDIALRDLAGISVPGALSYITQDTLDGCINKERKNPFFSDIISVGTKDSLTIEQFFHMEVTDKQIYHCPMFIHLDLSLSGDRTGISGNSITGRKDITTIDGKVLSLPAFTHIFTVAIQAPRGDKIPYDKILSFILWLRQRNFNIQSVSRDQFQSEYMGQLLEAQGIESPKISLDRTPDGYDALKSVLLEKRIDMLDCELLQSELIHLQRDSVSGRLDHPVGGSKDAADSFAGSIWNGIMQNPAVNVPINEMTQILRDVNLQTNYRPNSLGAAFQNLYSGNKNFHKHR